MITLVAAASDLQGLRAALLNDAVESAAILLCVPVSLKSSGDWRLILKEIHVPPPEAYEERTVIAARLRPEFGLRVEKRAKENGWSLVYCHTHPHQLGQVAFSRIDDAAEVQLARYAEQRSPGKPHLALVMGPNSVAARMLGAAEPARIIQIGPERYQILSEPQAQTHDEPIYDRQVRAFGPEAQTVLRNIRVAIVGAGGTGSVVAQQLAYLGVSQFCLVDPDKIDVSNLNRTVGASTADIGEPKALITKRLIQSIRPEATVTPLVCNVLSPGFGRHIAEYDFIFCCTDSHGSRHLLNQLSYQYMVPMIDLGVSLSPSDQGGLHIGGHVKCLTPGLACLWCIPSIDPKKVREDFMTLEQRKADPYFAAGAGVVQPAVISVNSTMASMAVTMFLSMLTGMPSPPRYLVYDGRRGRIHGVAVAANPECIACSYDSTARCGDGTPLPEKPDGAN